MKAFLPTDITPQDQLTAMIARKQVTARSTILPFADYVDLLSNLFSVLGCPASRLVAVGHVTPVVSQAADRAGIELAEQLTPSPFAGDPTVVTQEVSTPRDIIYLANPNRITGATYSLAEMESMASAVPEGALVVDEHYYDYFRVSAFPITEMHSNVFCLRSFTAAFSINSADSGFVLGSSSGIEKIAQVHAGYIFSRTLGRTVEAVLANDGAVALRVREVHDESLRITEALDACGLQCRLSPTDFVLMRVADPGGFGNALAHDKIAIENLDGYPQMKNYVRYRIESPLNNDRLIRSIERMDPKHYYMKTPDGRMARSHHAPESTAPSVLRKQFSSRRKRGEIVDGQPTNRLMETPTTEE